MGAYPPAPAVELSGNMLAAKSKADETEYDRCILPAGLALSRGSSCSSDSLRDEDMLGRDDISDTPSSLPWLELASDASSSESRVCDGSPYGAIVTAGGLCRFRPSFRLSAASRPQSTVQEYSQSDGIFASSDKT